MITKTGANHSAEANSDQPTNQDWGDFSLMGLFRLEAETQVGELNRCLLAIEQTDNTINRQQALETLMRAAHSIKGAARIVQMEAAVIVAHALEDYFVAAIEGKLELGAQQVDVLLSGVDLLSRLSLIEEEKLSTQLPAYEVEAQFIASSISALATDVEKPATDVLPLKTNNQSARQESSEPAPDALKQSAESAMPKQLNASAQNEKPQVKKPTADTFFSAPKPEENATSTDRMIRISAENLNRLMGLAGESLVEANWLQPFSQSLLQVKRQQQNVLALLEHVEAETSPGSAVGQSTELSTNRTKEAVRAMKSAQQLLSEQLSDLDLFSRRFSQLSDGLYREVVASHMCAFEEGTKGYGRLVRDLAKSCDKLVKIKIDGLMTQVDRDILSKLDAPIVHLLTNAVVHGIEPAAQRRTMGKPETGTVRVNARHRSGMLAISVEDDGAGIDFMALRQKVVAKGLTTAELAEQMLESELLEFLFLPGFSTAESADALAGRGYGLDLARNMAQSVGGCLRVTSATCVGTKFQFQLPLTLSVVRSLLFEVASEPYALGLSRIERVLTLTPKQIHYSENRPYFVMEGETKGECENVSLVNAWQLLSLENKLNETTESSVDLSVVVLGEPGQRYGIRVDRFLEERELVVRPLDARLGKVPNVSAAAITERGEPVLILDVADIVRSAERVAAGRTVSTTDNSDFSTTDKASKRVLVVDDSMTVRAMEQKLLQNRGYEVETAVNGAEGWNTVRMNRYDLVITDVDMPRMSGIELIEQMKAYGPTQQIPVIVVSYKDKKEDQMAGLRAGANYYLTKSSFHDDGLINAVVDLIGE